MLASGCAYVLCVHCKLTDYKRTLERWWMPNSAVPHPLPPNSSCLHMPPQIEALIRSHVSAHLPPATNVTIRALGFRAHPYTQVCVHDASFCCLCSRCLRISASCQRGVTAGPPCDLSPIPLLSCPAGQGQHAKPGGCTGEPVLQCRPDSLEAWSACCNLLGGISCVLATDATDDHRHKPPCCPYSAAGAAAADGQPTQVRAVGCHHPRPGCIPEAPQRHHHCVRIWTSRWQFA